MNISIDTKEYFDDILKSFSYTTHEINLQLEKDFPRMIVIINGRRISEYNNFKFIINNLLYPDIFKKLAWCIPTQVSYFFFYKMMLEHYRNINANYILAELEGNRPDNKMVINYNFDNNKSYEVLLSKNFRLVETVGDEIIVRYIIRSVAKIKVGETRKVDFTFTQEIPVVRTRSRINILHK
jgi:hypothetical protein